MDASNVQVSARIRPGAPFSESKTDKRTVAALKSDGRLTPLGCNFSALRRFGR